MILLLVSFVAGLLTALAPCVLPLLPIIVGGGMSGGKSLRRAIVVTTSLAVSIILFTLLLKVSTLLINVPADFWNVFSGGIIITFGIVSLFPSLWEKIPFLSNVHTKSNHVLASGYKKQNIWGDIIVGAALGPVFSSCSPTYFLVLAAVLPESFTLGIIYLIAYSVGLSLSLLLITFVGQRVLDKAGFVSNPHGMFKKFLGVIFILVGITIITGADKTLQLRVLELGFFDVTSIEHRLLELIPSEEVEGPLVVDGAETEKPGITNEVEIKEAILDEAEITEEEIVDTPPQRKATPTETVPAVINNPPALTPAPTTPPPRVSKRPRTTLLRAPEIVNPSGFINTGGEPITFEEFEGKKVVLVSFWTYSCINCQRTLPYLNDWYDTYRNQGLEIVSIHTPEFAFEKLLENVEEEVFNTYNIKYPVVLDNDRSTWRAFENHFWPRRYLIDIDGNIVYDHIGEGAYAETEGEIQKALAERAERLQ